MMTRRHLLQLGLAAAALSARPAAQRRAAPGVLRELDRLYLRNPENGDRLPLSAFAPVFEFDDFTLGGPPAGPGEWQRGTGGVWIGRWRIEGAHPAEIVTTLTPDDAAGVCTRTVDFRLLGGRPAVLRTVTLEEVDASGQAPSVRQGAPQSYPALLRSFFVGVRYPVAFVEAAGHLLRFGHRPGRRLVPGERYTTRTVVYGASSEGMARAAFEAYIAGLRPAPRGVHFNYNSWWTSPVPYCEKDILGLIEAFRRNLYEPHGVAPDTFCIDMGWSRNTSIWQIDPSLFPEGFENLRKACEGIGSHLGLWISPSAVYAPALDLAWARSAGYEADSKACLGGPKYQSAFKAALLDHVSRFDIRHIKFDGYVPTCDATDHGHEPGIYSAERIAEGLIDVFVSLRSIAPDLWMEPTCFGFDPSPWWLEYVNSVIGTFGDDAPHGRVPCPVYRESYTTARDFYNLKGAHDILVPIAAQEVLGVIHQTDEPLDDDAVTTLLRGHQFVPLYINPAHMTPRRWSFLANAMKWTREHAEVLAHTVPRAPEGWANSLESRMPRKPYGYGHWHEGRGLLCLRNPWIEPATVQVVPARDLGAPPGSGPLSCTMVYPLRSPVAGPIGPDEPHTVSLAPYETCVIAYTPARSSRRTAPAPRRAATAGAAELSVRASLFQADDRGPRFGPDYTRMLPSDGVCGRVRISGSLTAPAYGLHELLILIEGPSPVDEPVCTLEVNGRAAKPEVRSSEAGWCATGAPAPEHWLWLALPLRQGRTEISGEVLVGGSGQTVSAWLANRQRIAQGRQTAANRSLLPPPEELWTDAVPAFSPLQFHGNLPVERGPAPVVRIRGVYLDALDPVEQSQGFGKLERNRSVWLKPISIGGKRYLRGLGTHAVSRLVYALDGKYRRFQAWAGPDDAANPTITMEVRVDGRSVWRSGLLTRGVAAHRVDVDVQGARRLELLVGDGGNGISADHADWADAMLLE